MDQAKNPRLEKIAQVLKQVKACRIHHLGDSSPSSDKLWTHLQWWQMFQSLSLGQDNTHDDLLFFVLRNREDDSDYAQQQSPPSASIHADTPSMPFIVRRRALSLPAELQLSGSLFPAIDWQKTTLLNYVLHTSYKLTVVSCSKSSLGAVANSTYDSEGTLEVTKEVFASPTRTLVNLSGAKTSSSTPTPSYPSICFAVDNFEDAFEGTVLHRPDDCFCVVLLALLEQPHTHPPAHATPTPHNRPLQHTAAAQDLQTSLDHPVSTITQNSQNSGHSGSGSEAHQSTSSHPALIQCQLEAEVLAASHSQDSHQEVKQHDQESVHSGGGVSESLEIPPSSNKPEPSPTYLQPPSTRRKRVILFSGYVVQEAITRSSVFAQQPIGLAGKVLNAVLGTGQAARIVHVGMSGPGGVGRAQVAISINKQEEGMEPGGSFGGGNLVQRMAGLVRQRIELFQQQQQQQQPDASQSMHCALMTLDLPVEDLAVWLMEANLSEGPGPSSGVGKIYLA